MMGSTSEKSPVFPALFVTTHFGDRTPRTVSTTCVQSFLRALSQALVPEPRFELGPSYEERISSRNERGGESTFI